MALRAILRAAKPRAWRWPNHHHHHPTTAHDFLLHCGRRRRPGLLIPNHQYWTTREIKNPKLFEIDDDKVAEYFGGVFSVSNNHEEALASAQFAVSEHNKTTHDGQNIRFQRLVRASRMQVVSGHDYFLTLEAIDENGELNVYYAEVCDSPASQTKKHLRHWQLVDHSFSYPFSKLSKLSSDRESFMERFHRCQDGRMFLLRVFLPTLTLKYKDDASPITFEESQHGPYIGNPDRARQTMNSEEGVTDTTGSPSSSSNDDNIDPHTVASTNVVPVYNMIHCGKVAYYAASAVRVYREKKGQRLCLTKILHASKEYIDGKVLYVLLLKVINEKRVYSFLRAMLEVSELKEEESIKWHVLDELFAGPLTKIQNKRSIQFSPGEVSDLKEEESIKGDVVE